MMNTVPGYMKPEECAFLRQLFTRHNSTECIGFEVGSLFGRSSVEISQAIPKGILVCVDRWEGWALGKPQHSNPLLCQPAEGMVNTLENFRAYTKDYKNIMPIRGSSPQVIKDWKIPIDFLFLDSGHRNPDDRNNLEFFLPLLKPGATLSGHDYIPEWPDVVENVKWLEILLNKKVRTKNTIWYFQLD